MAMSLYEPKSICGRCKTCGTVVAMHAVKKDKSNAGSVADSVREWIEDGLLIGTCGIQEALSKCCCCEIADATFGAAMDFIDSMEEGK